MTALCFEFIDGALRASSGEWLFRISTHWSGEWLDGWRSGKQIVPEKFRSVAEAEEKAKAILGGQDLPHWFPA